MDEQEKGPLDKLSQWLSSWKVSFDRLRQRFGMPVAGLLTLSVAGGLVWWNWDDIAKRPGVEWVLAWFNQRALPTAPAGRLTIAVAHLDNDQNRQEETVLLDGLRQFEGVEVQQVDRTIKWPTADTESEAKKKAEETARNLLTPGLLKKNRADVLIWGSVISSNNKSAMRLYWTPAREVPGAKSTGKYQPQSETIELPSEFWSDLKQILGLLTQSRIAALTFDQGGHYVAELAPLIAQVRALIQSRKGVWNPETLAGVQFSLAIALAIDGEQSGNNEPLAESIALFRKVQDEYTRESVPLQWAATQMNLGVALFHLGERESGTARLEEAITAYRNALQEYTRVRVPLQWAMTQMNLGNALDMLGARESGTARLEEAITAYRDALQERTRARVPFDWAATQMNLGVALFHLGERESGLGERESGTARLEEAVTAYRDALQEWTRARVPLLWGMTQNNLGEALKVLGKRETGTARLEEAITAYRDALQERTRARAPLQWARTQMNLGTALQALGERESGTARLEEAVAAYREALRELTRARAPLQWAMTQDNLGNVLDTLGARESGTARLEEAVAAYREALQERTREHVPLDWAVSTGNQGEALMHLAERTRDAAMAETAFRQIETASKTLRPGGYAAAADYFEARLAKARAIRDQLKAP
jgi:tetratricopeptide (TPR) repeat protein